MTGQLALAFKQSWGGRRAGAGRKRDPKRRDPMHVSRPEHKARYPLHVVMRTVPDVPRLRSGLLLSSISTAIAQSKTDGFRLAHLSIQHNHLHLLVEADDSTARTRGMQRLTIAMARAINAALHRRGKVFAYRYHATTIQTPRQMRNTLAYVLCNWRHHREDLGSPAARAATFDWYASAAQFYGWTLDSDGRSAQFSVRAPQTWLLRIGWKVHGPIDPLHVPKR